MSGKVVILHACSKIAQMRRQKWDVEKKKKGSADGSDSSQHVTAPAKRDSQCVPSSSQHELQPASLRLLLKFITTVYIQ
eukprot:6184038-Pleurochrysis_carterae.AAC.1